MHSMHLLRRVLLIIFFCMAQGIFLLSPVFKIAHVRVEGNNLFSAEEVERESPYKPGLLYWAVWLNCGSHPLSDPAILENSVSLERNGQAVIKIKERQPAVLVYSEKSRNHWFIVDKEGYILGEERPGVECPRLKVDFDIPRHGQMKNALINVVLKAAPQFEKTIDIKPLFYSVDSVQSVSAHINFLDHETLIKLGTLDNFNVKLEIARTLLNQFKMKLKKVDIIDVRFNNVFIKEYKPGKVTASATSKNNTKEGEEGNSSGPASEQQSTAETEPRVEVDSINSNIEPSYDSGTEPTQTEPTPESQSPVRAYEPAAEPSPSSEPLPESEDVYPQTVDIGNENSDAPIHVPHFEGGGVVNAGEAPSIP